ncbi:cupin domain-containing protein [Rubricoccus marinus]|uniref:Mannose-6-phosphate isomerase n=1 Tax=Rubricoccus marinus TaxID=716817 RepID=A0A259TWH2_9BACT|nr:cupin domain-containing protein [Rubricoccus marinus]OZC02119.1 mannose-6-phosphate isomerase [Rubricoccus marinus]
MPDPINLDDKLDRFSETWTPKIIAALNGQHVKLAHLEGEFVWHAHAEEDELFFVARGRLRIEMRDGSVELGPGDLFVVPRGVEHRPVALPTASVMLFEPASTAHTGDVVSERTVTDLDWI